jgi:hypothetical protein
VLFYLIVLAAWVAGNLVFLRSRPPVRNPLVYAEAQRFHSDMLLRISDQGERLRGLSIGMLAGSLAGNVFCLKSWVELLQVSVAEGSIANWCWEPVAWVCLFGYNLVTHTQMLKELWICSCQNCQRETNIFCPWHTCRC